MVGHKFTSIDEYIATFPKETQVILESIRETIHKAAPKAVEAISYNMPAFKQNGKDVLVYFAGYKKHIGFYPTAFPVEIFKDDLKPYKYSKGAVQFPIDKPMPFDLIVKFVKFRLKQVEK